MSAVVQKSNDGDGSRECKRNEYETPHRNLAATIPAVGLERDCSQGNVERERKDGGVKRENTEGTLVSHGLRLTCPLCL